MRIGANQWAYFLDIFDKNVDIFDQIIIKYPTLCKETSTVYTKFNVYTLSLLLFLVKYSVFAM